MGMGEREIGSTRTMSRDNEESIMQLEEAIVVARNALLPPTSSSPQHLLPSLDNLENVLMRVKQLPFNSIQSAMDTLLKVLTTKELLNHLDVDVRVYLAACFNQILRITGRSAHHIKQIKEILSVIVSAFKSMSDKSAPSHHKQVSMLGTMAGSRLCLLMVDLECDTLILDLFKHFLRNIRENQPAEVFSSMGFIMIVFLQEIKEVSIELLSTLLDSVRNRNQDALLIARKLGERVIENCALKLAPYMYEAVQHLGFPLCDYSKIVAHVYALQLQTPEDDETLNSQDNGCVIHLSTRESSHKPSIPCQLDPRENGHLASTMSTGNKADKGSNSRRHAKRCVKRSKDLVDLLQTSGCSQMEEFRSPSLPDKACNQDVGGSSSLVQSASISNIASLQAEGIERSSGEAPEEYSLHGQVKKKRDKNSKNSANLPQVSGCSLIKEAHSTELLEVCNQNIVSSPSLSRPAIITEISSPQANDNARSEDWMNGESTAALPCTPKNLADGISPNIPRGQDRTSVPSDDLKPDGVTNELGGRQSKENASEVDGGTTMGGNSDDNLKIVCGLQSLSGRSFLLVKTPISRLKWNSNPDMKKGILTHVTSQDVPWKPKSKKAKVNAGTLAEEMTTSKCMQDQGKRTSTKDLNFAENGSRQINKSPKDFDNLGGNHTCAVNSEDEAGQNGAKSKISATKLVEVEKEHSSRKGGIDNRSGKNHLPADFLLKDLILPRFKKPRTNRRAKSSLILKCTNLVHVQAALQKDPATGQRDL